MGHEKMFCEHQIVTPTVKDYSEHQAQSARPLLKGRDPTKGTSQTNKDRANILLQDPCAHIMNQGYRRY